MKRFIKILGDGQIWDIKRISESNPEETFEDLFSGRALGRMAEEGAGIFCRFKEKGRITGFSVTKALLSNDKTARQEARALIENLAKNAGLGIEALTKGKGFKQGWQNKEKSYWKNLDIVIIGGGVSEGKTGRILVKAIKKYLAENSLSNIKVEQARFPGKEAGFLGAVINAINEVCAEAKTAKQVGGIGLDLGREEIGVGLLAIDTGSCRLIKQNKNYWLFRHSVRTPGKNYLKSFLDRRKDYSEREKETGRRIRTKILQAMADLIIEAKKAAEKKGLACSRNIGAAVPGRASSQGYILNSTDYLPFFRKQDGFNLAKNLETILSRKKLPDCRLRIVNDGIAAGIANVYFGASAAKAESAKFGFLGAGSGLGGCAGLINAK